MGFAPTLLYKMPAPAAGAEAWGHQAWRNHWESTSVVQCGHQSAARSWEGHDIHSFRTFQRASEQDPLSGQQMRNSPRVAASVLPQSLSFSACPAGFTLLP